MTKGFASCYSFVYLRVFFSNTRSISHNWK